MSHSRMMLLTSAKETKTYLCCELYAWEGSESAGRIDVTKSVKISY